MALAPGRAYYLLPVRLTDARTVTIVTKGDFLDVYTSDADLSKVYLSVDDGPALPIANILPAEFAILFSRITLSWEASEVGKSLTLLVGGEYKYRRHIQAVKVVEDWVSVRSIRHYDHRFSAVTLLSSSARTSGGTGSDVDVSWALYGEVLLRVTAVSGTSPVLNVYIEGKDETTSVYKVLGSFTNISATGEYWLTLMMIAFRYLRVRWEISGTSPSFTFGVFGSFKA